MLVESNASISKVTAQAKEGDPGSDRAAVAGPEKFVGSVRAFFRQKRERETRGGDDVYVTRRFLIVDTRDPAIAWAAGDDVEFARDSTLTLERGTVRSVGGLELAALAGTGVETTTLELQPT